MARKKQKRRTDARRWSRTRSAASALESTLAKKTTRLYCTVFFALGFLLYANTITHDFVLDDQIVVTSNSFVMQGGMAGLENIFSNGFLVGYNGQSAQSYRPMALASLLLEREFVGTSPHVHHFFNVLLFAAICLMLFLLLQQLFRATASPMVLFTTTLFATHPIHTEVVANIKGRDELLALFFLLVALWSFFRELSSKRGGLKTLSVVAFFLATISKETATTGMVILPLAYYFFRDDPPRKILKAMVPYAVVIAVYAILRFSILDRVTYEADLLVLNNAMMSVPDMSRRLATAVAVLGLYLRLIVVPHPLSFDYSYNQFPIVDWTHWRTLLSLALNGGLMLVAVWGFKRKQIMSFAVLFWAISIVLVSNLLTLIGATAAERFLFSPSVGYCLALSYGVCRLFKLYPAVSDERLRKAGFAVVAVIALLYSAKTVTRNLDWKNEQTLYTSGLRTAPNSARAHRHYASYVYRDAEQDPDPDARNAKLRDAVNHFSRAVEILPEFTEAWIDLGTSYYALDEDDNAMRAFQQSLKIEPMSSRAKNNIGLIHYNRGEGQLAKQFLEEAVAIDPDNMFTLGNLAMALELLGERERALELYERAVPKSPGHLDKLIALCDAMGETDKAAFYRRIQAGAGR